MWEEVYDSEDSVDPKAAFFREQRIKCADQNLKSTVLLALPTPATEVSVEKQDKSEANAEADGDNMEVVAYKAAGFEYDLVQSDFSDYVKPERKTRKKSPKGREEATVIRDEPERNLFLECLLSVNQPPTATDPPERRRSARQSQSTPSPSTQKKSRHGLMHGH